MRFMGFLSGQKVDTKDFDIDLECELKKLEGENFKLKGVFKIGPFYRPNMHSGILNRLLRKELEPAKLSNVVLYMGGPRGSLHYEEFEGTDKVYGSAYRIRVYGQMGEVEVYVRGVGNYDETGKLVLKAVEHAIKEYKKSQEPYNFAV